MVTVQPVNIELCCIAAGTLLVITSHDFYDSLRPEDQEIFDETWKDSLLACAQGMYDETMHSTPAIEDQGNFKVNIPTPEQSRIWLEACQEYAFPTWRGICEDLGYDATEAERILGLWQELIEKYTP